MRVSRELFEHENYPEKFPEFKRLMAFCDGNNLRMAFYDEVPYIGIRVYTANNDAVGSTNYTLYYDTMDKKVHFLRYDNWDEGFAELLEILTREAEWNGEKATPFNVDFEYLETQYEKKKEEKRKLPQQFDFKVLYNDYTENVAVFDESKWLAIAQMRKLYPDAKFELVSENGNK